MKTFFNEAIRIVAYADLTVLTVFPLVQTGERATRHMLARV